MTAPEAPAIVGQTLVTADGTVYGANLQPVPFAQLAGDPVPAAELIPPAELVAEERDRATELARQLRDRVRSWSSNRPRSLQTKLGPSEVGTPCLRQLAYKAAQHPRVNLDGGDPWPSFVGTATHAALEDVFDGSPDEWRTELRVEVDADLDLAGSTDLLRLTGGVTVVDHKVVGTGTMTKTKRHGPAGYYVVQANLYAHGLIAAGIPVEWVAIAYWPRSGQLSGLHVWLRRYDQAVVDRALVRLDVVRRLHGLLGAQLFGQLPTAAHYCDSCPFYSAHATDPAVSCAGADR